MNACRLSLNERTVIVACWLRGALDGGVYTAENLGSLEEGVSVPQAGEQSVFATDKVHLTP